MMNFMAEYILHTSMFLTGKCPLYFLAYTVDGIKLTNATAALLLIAVSHGTSLGICHKLQKFCSLLV